MGAGMPQLLDDSNHHHICFRHHFIGPEPKHVETLTRQPDRTALVVARCVEMLRSINLNRQLEFETGKVEHIAADWMLTAKLRAKLLMAQT